MTDDEIEQQLRGPPGRELRHSDIEKLKHDISRAEQFVINFNYLARTVQRRERAM